MRKFYNSRPRIESAGRKKPLRAIYYLSRTWSLLSRRLVSTKSPYLDPIVPLRKLDKHASLWRSRKIGSLKISSFPSNSRWEPCASELIIFANKLLRIGKRVARESVRLFILISKCQVSCLLAGIRQCFCGFVINLEMRKEEKSLCCQKSYLNLFCSAFRGQPPSSVWNGSQHRFSFLLLQQRLLLPSLISS